MQTKYDFSKILQGLSDFWTSMVQLRSQLDVLAIKFPVKIECSLDGADGTSGFKAIASVLFTKHKAKALIKFIFDSDTFSSWPMSLASVGCEVEVAYGTLKYGFLLVSPDSVTDYLLLQPGEYSRSRPSSYI